MLALNAAILVRSKHLEKSIIYEDSRGGLQKQDKLLRLKDHNQLMLKIPTILSGEGKFKTRKQIKIEISKGDVRELLLELGYKELFRYEKWREVWELDGMRICLDEVPFLGNVVEIEGDEDSIEKMAHLLEMGALKTSNISYVKLFWAYAEAQELKAKQMTFDAQNFEES